MERIVARDSQLRLLCDTLGRRRYVRRRARMQAENLLRFAIIPDDEIGIEILQHGLYERRLLSMLFDDVLAPFRENFAHKAALDVDRTPLSGPSGMLVHGASIG